MEVQDRDPITAINAADQIIAVWNRDEDIGDSHMDVYVQGFAKDGALGTNVNSSIDPASLNFHLAPNPFGDWLAIDFDDQLSIEAVEIFSARESSCFKILNLPGGYTCKPTTGRAGFMFFGQGPPMAVS